MLSNKSEYLPFPGNNGKDCIFNGNHFDKNGNPIECRCDECSYMMCCLESFSTRECERCAEQNCPRFSKQGQD